MTVFNFETAAAAAPERVVHAGGVLELDLGAAAPGCRAEPVAYVLRQAPLRAVRSIGNRLPTASNRHALFSVEWGAATDVTLPTHVRVKMLQGTLAVVAFESKPWGFAVRFDGLTRGALPQLHGIQALEVLVTGQSCGPVGGTVVHDRDGKGFAFILSGEAMAPDAYTIWLCGEIVSRADTPPADGLVHAAENGVSDPTTGVSPGLRLPGVEGESSPVPNTGTDDETPARSRTDGVQSPYNSPVVDLAGDFANFGL